MSLRRAAAPVTLALAALAGCTPAARGRCASDAACHDGARCSLEGICLAQSGTCSVPCDKGEICNQGVCTALKPVVEVRLGSSTLLSPAFPTVSVHVDASHEVALHGLSVEVNTDHVVASGSIATAAAGDNTVTLTQFEPNAAGDVSVSATLAFGASDSVRSVAKPATVDAAPPTVTVSVPATPDAVNGWVPRTTATLEVHALVEDGAGSGPQAATLTLDACTAPATCSFPGSALSSPSPGATLFAFQVPRFAQAAGSEAALAVTVKATDRAANQGQGSGTLKIDDAPPQIGTFTLVTGGAKIGEDGKAWYVGGIGATDVEIAVPVSEAGAGLTSLVLHLNPVDVTTGVADPTGTAAGDGTVHFRLPAGGVRNREGALRFSLTATDALQHASSIPVNSILVDALAPFVTPPRVDYASAPAGACGPADSGTFACGRQTGTPAGSHLLRDDTANVSFEITDCGVGIAPGAQPKATAGSIDFAVHEVGTLPSNPACANGNRMHQFSFTLDLSQVAIGGAGPSGTVLVPLSGNAVDLLGNTGSSLANAGASGDGLALVSLWRWRSKLTGAATGSPALLPGTAGARQVAIGTGADPSASPNLYLLSADGSQAMSWQVPPGIAGDLAAGPSTGKIYAVSGTANGKLNIVPLGGAAIEDCGSRNGSTFGAPPVILTSSGEQALVVATARNNVLTNDNFFVFDGGTGSCNMPTNKIATAPADFNGVTGTNTAVYTGHAQGFTSYDTSGGNALSYKTSVTALAPPALASSGANPIFPDSTNHMVRKTVKGCPVVGPTCWDDVATFAANSALPYTPVYDATAAWAVDDAGTVYRWLLSDGSRSFAPVALGAATSAPVLLQDGSALLVQNNAFVTVVSAAGTTTSLGKVNAFGGAQLVAAPVLDVRGATGVAYVPSGNSWVWAVQTPSPPLAGNNGNWPRPGHDSCNSRNLDTSGSACP